MKIEIRSPFKIERDNQTLTLIEEVKKATEKDLKPKIAFAKRVKARMAKQLIGVAKTLTEEE